MVAMDHCLTGRVPATGHLAVAALPTERTSFVIAHRLSTIRHVDRILVLHRGRLVEEGTHEELLRHGKIYAKLYQIEFQPQEETAPAG